MLRKAFCILALSAVLLAVPGSVLTPRRTARSAEVEADDTVVYLPFIARAAAPRTIDWT